MAESQQHGLLFERMVLLASGALSDRADQEPIPYTARFDIPEGMDPEGQGIPTSVKTTKRGKNGKIEVGMADARRTLELSSHPHTRMIVGVYKQVGNHKHVEEVREYIISSETWKEASGHIDPALVAQFHVGLAEGSVQESRAWAKAHKKDLVAQHPSVLKWVPKILAKGRRLQCSLPLDELETLLDPLRDVLRVHTPHSDTALWGLPLPLVMESPPRARKKKIASEAHVLPVAEGEGTPQQT